MHAGVGDTGRQAGKALRMRQGSGRRTHAAIVITAERLRGISLGFFRFVMIDRCKATIPEDELKGFDCLAGRHA